MESAGDAEREEIFRIWEWGVWGACPLSRGVGRRLDKATGGVEDKDNSSAGGRESASAGGTIGYGLWERLLQLTGCLIHANKMEGSADERPEKVDGCFDKCSLVGGIICLPFVRPRKGDVERDRLWEGEWTERRGVDTHVDDLDASELGEPPSLADGEGAVGIEL